MLERKRLCPFRHETGTPATLCSYSKHSLEHTSEKLNDHFLAAPLCNIWYIFCVPRFPRGVNCFFLSTFLSHLQHFTIFRNLAANLKQSPQFRATLRKVVATFFFPKKKRNLQRTATILSADHVEASYLLLFSVADPWFSAKACFLKFNTQKSQGQATHTDSRSKLFLPIAYFTTTGEEAEEVCWGSHKRKRKEDSYSLYLITVYPRNRTGVRLTGSCQFKSGRKQLLVVAAELLIPSFPPNRHVIVMHPLCMEGSIHHEVYQRNNRLHLLHASKLV